MKKTATLLFTMLIAIMAFGQGNKSELPGAAILLGPGDDYNITDIEWLDLEWEAGEGAIPDGFRVYFDEVNPPQNMIYDGTDTYYFIGEDLEVQKEYFWKVVPYNAQGDAANVPVWSFSTLTLVNMWEETFTDDTSVWTVENLGDSPYEWEFTGMRASISTPWVDEEDEDPQYIPVWSTLTSPGIDCTDRENVRLYVNMSLDHWMDFENYYAKIFVSNNGQLWEQVAVFDGDLYEKFGWDLPYYQFNISNIADNQAEVFVKFEFNSNGDWDINWSLDKVGFDASPEVGIPHHVIIKEPADGQNFDSVDGVSFNWETVSGPIVDGYRLYLDENNPPTTVAYEGTMQSYYAQDLEDNTTYYFSVAPFNDYGEPDELEVRSFTTFQLDYIYEEDFTSSPVIQPDWEIENLSGSEFEWELTGEVAEITAPEDDESETAIWSTITSPVFSITGYHILHVDINHELDLGWQTWSFYARIEASVDNGETWETVKNYEGFQYSWANYSRHNISHIADGHSEMQLRLHFNSEDNRDISWIVERIGVLGTPVQEAPNPVVLTYPENGVNDSEISSLSWVATDGPLADGYKVFLGETNPPQELFYDGSDPVCYPELDVDKEYFWMVVPYNAYGEPDEVEVWSFTTFELEIFFEEEFTEWTIENLSGADNQWQLYEWGIEIITPEDNGATSVWSSLTSPMIDCSHYTMVHIGAYHGITHHSEFDNYYARILASTDGENFELIKSFEGDLGSAGNANWFLGDIDISEVADNSPQVWIRFEFNSNEDNNLRWALDDIVLKGIEMDFTNVVSPEMAQLQVYPNPSAGMVNVVSEVQIQRISMFDILGKLVYSADIQNESARIEVGHLNNGVYLLQVHTQNGVITNRIQIAK